MAKKTIKKTEKTVHPETEAILKAHNVPEIAFNDIILLETEIMKIANSGAMTTFKDILTYIYKDRMNPLALIYIGGIFPSLTSYLSELMSEISITGTIN